MTVRAFVDEGPLTAGREVVLADDEAHYVRRVRRAEVGDTIEILDGVAHGVHATIVAADAKRVTVRLADPLHRPAGPARVVWLGRPDPRAALEAITTACEAGATTMVLVTTTYAHHAHPSEPRIARTLRAAQRQCGRLAPLQVVGPLDLEATLARDDPRPAYLADPVASEPFVHPAAGEGATVLIGPEGGLHPDEVARARAAGLHPLSLSPWILRSQTAVGTALGRLWIPPPL